MNVEQRTLSEELQETQRIRDGYRPLRAVNCVGKLIDSSTNTRKKKIVGFVGMMGVVALSMIVDGNFAIGAAEGLALIGGATVGEKIPIVSGSADFIKEKRAIKRVRKEQEVSVKKIANLLDGFSDFVDEEEVKLWTKGQLKVESLKHPGRYHIMEAVLANNLEAPEVVVEKFMKAQKLAVEDRRSKKNMNKEALKRGADMTMGIGLMVGLTNYVSFGLGYQSQAGIVGLADDVVLYTTLGYSFAKEKIKTFRDKYK